MIHVITFSSNILQRVIFLFASFFFKCLPIFFKCLFILAVLHLHCYMTALSSCSKQGPLSSSLWRLLTAVASLAVDHGL